MQYKIATLFDYSKKPIRPLQTLVLDRGKRTYHTLFLPGTGLKIKKIFGNMQKVEFDGALLNDFKAHMQGYKLDPGGSYKVWDLASSKQFNIIPKSESHGREILDKIIDSYPDDLKPWREVFAKAQQVYQFLEKRGAYLNGQRVWPQYGTTFSGRSKTSGFNIQGTTKDDDIMVNPQHKYLIHFDWIAADLRMASFMSKDPDLEETFVHSDPYDKTLELLDDEVDRDDCKREFLSSIYSLSVSSPILDIYPAFKQWIIDKIEEMGEIGSLKSVLGRSYKVKNDNEKSVFSGMIQGSVAHAMQICLWKIYKVWRDNLFTETHDAITMSCNKEDLKLVISSVVDVMIRPFKHMMPEDPILPVRVYIGERWKKWKLYKAYREES